MLGCLTEVIQALCVNVDQKYAAENLGCERDPPASPIPAELRRSCGCTSNAGSHPRFAAGWELSATEVFRLCTAWFAQHPFQDAGMHLPSFSSGYRQSYTASGTQFALHGSRLLLGYTTQVSFFHSMCRWFSIREGNNTTNGNISTSSNKNKSQQPFHQN